jgi:predicted DNA-binding protein YlxM (UPF0122 family)
MEKNIEIALLLDFYGSLLTKRQFESLDLHYNNDFSLAEIGEEFKISRQGVFENIKKGKETLMEYEEKLGLIGRFISQKKLVNQAYEAINEVLEIELDNKSKSKIDLVKVNLKQILDDF